MKRFLTNFVWPEHKRAALAQWNPRLLSSNANTGALRTQNAGLPQLAGAVGTQRVTEWLRENVWLVIFSALGVSVRLIYISQPYVDAWSWKQATIAMIAENFYRNGFHLFYPQVNWGGSIPGYIGSEFPLVPFFAALLYVPFGVHEWIGRSISVLFFALSIPFFHLLVRDISSKRIAQFATAIYVLSPLSIFASRSFQSDMASLTLAIAALYLFHRWLCGPNDRSLFWAAVGTTSLAILLKLPAIIISVPFVFMAWEEYGIRVVRDRKLWAFAVLSLALPFAWYCHAYLVSISNPPYHFTGEHGLAIEGLDWYLEIFYGVLGFGLTPVISAAMLIGLFFRSEKKHGQCFHVWFLAICLFIVFAGYGNRHPWYQLPLVPVAAALAARAYDRVLGWLVSWSRPTSTAAAVHVIFFGAVVGLSYIYVEPLYAPWAKPIWDAAIETRRITPDGALVIFADDGDSSGLYYSERKGWHAFLDDSRTGNPLHSDQAIRALEDLRKQGAAYLVFSRNTLWWLDYYREFRQYLDAHYTRARDTEDYIIFDLSKHQLQADSASRDPDLMSVPIAYPRDGS